MGAEGGAPSNTSVNGSVIPRGLSQLGPEVRQLLMNLSSSSSDIQPPSIFHYLPHLIGKSEGLSPHHRLSKGRVGVSIAIGIPHIKRDGVVYIMETLQSLIESLDEVEKSDCVIIVCIAEPEHDDYVKKTSSEVEKMFPDAVRSGLLEVISPPKIFYPSFKNLKETFGDPIDRVKWRTKQNLDYSFLMLYAKSKATYYVQLEDDVVTKPGYFTTMKNFALNQKTDEWLILEYSNLGFIGKLFKSSDLSMVVEFFLMFYKDKPIDWLLDHMLWVKACSPERDAKHCARMKSEIKRTYKPSLYQHIGLHSSLKGKVQKLKDKTFGKRELHRAHLNPTADVTTTMKVYQQYTLERAYLGETFFWAYQPTKGDTLNFKFHEPQYIESLTFKSGNIEHPGDRFYNTSVEILPVKHLEKQKGILDNEKHEDPYPKTPDGYLVVDHFSHTTGGAFAKLNSSIGAVSAVQLVVLTESDVWVILSEIYIKTYKPQPTR
ncbi:unnamed protein product [Owenia fusiformis]|uniref:Alpha-1,3-mannosyl-glycoprotein 4-beta-N-acetylglucosaminyltransferase B n=1 Tax=Owenia fusiformis TaxID=6347 RepID=A0A8S4NB71_OWEFU|nr:unnamed protein product [Owenia fusiformis]